ncbi:MAG TPA: hypothetical protein PLR82_06560 [Bacillota bacterium]|nr:hypothetical protein [Bacillota bacterium]HPZ85996.1 hypothetical protein [Bacillota bacterium]HQD86456.1 hypothetical protein [Bacillota bacterium]
MLALLLIALSYALRMDAMGEGGQSLEPSDPLVEAALEFAADDLLARHVVTQGTFMSARRAKGEVPDEAFRISIGFIHNNHPWLVTVGFDAQGETLRLHQDHLRDT